MDTVVFYSLNYQQWLCLSSAVASKTVTLERQTCHILVTHTSLVSQVVHYHSVVSNSASPWTTGHQASLSTTNSQSLPKSMCIELVIPSHHLILCCPLLLLPSIIPSIRVFSNESVLCTRWPKYWSFSFIISPSNEYWGLISFRTDWFISLQSNGLSKSLFQQQIQKHQFLGTQFSLWSNSHIHTWLLEKP